jgi:hypothetical protein
MAIEICARCDKRERGCRGACACTVTGRDIHEQIAIGCPVGKFLRPPEVIPTDYEPTAVNATVGGCGCKK